MSFSAMVYIGGVIELYMTACICCGYFIGGDSRSKWRTPLSYFTLGKIRSP